MDTNSIAIIGMSCRFPDAENYDEYWENLIHGRKSISEIPSDRWNWREFYGDPQKEKNKSNSKWGGFVSNVDLFDPTFFGISPREAEWMDPQQRLLLELSWQCIQDAGYLPEQLSGKDVGVYLGIGTFDYQELQNRNCKVLDGHRATGVFNSILANRISYFFNFHGPSLPVDTACSASLVALHQAVNAIKLGECESALVGGINLLATPSNFISFGQAGMLSPTGSCKSFDESADGYVRGEGCGLVFLKPLDKAIMDDDNILGVIKGSAVNHGGKARSITSPNAMSQSKVIVTAFTNAGISPSTVNYIETHGTGTPLGDPIEVHGLTRAFKQLHKNEAIKSETGYCGLGAVKTNIGHLEPASGIAGVIKILLAMKYRTLPGNANFNKLNPRIKLKESPFYILEDKREWKPLLDKNGVELPLRAGISSFGYGGVNSHVILEEAPMSVYELNQSKCVTQTQFKSEPSSYLLTISANNKEALKKLAGKYIELIANKESSLADICSSANNKVTQMKRRLSVSAGDKEQMVSMLKKFIQVGKATQGIKFSAHAGDKPLVGFLLTGQGSQYIGMGSELYTSQPVFKKVLDECDEILREYLDLSIIDLMFTGEQQQLNRTCYTQPALFSIEYALSNMWLAYGIKPDVLIGHSIGEIVAACLAGVFSLQDALRMVSKRGELMDSLHSQGAMTAVFASQDIVQELIVTHELNVDIAASNAPDSSVISGERLAVAKAIELITKKGIESVALEVSQGFHSRLMDPMLDQFFDEIKDIKFSTPKYTLISNVTGKEISDEILDPQYWVDHARKPVLFQQGIKCMQETGVDVYLEIGPKPILSGLTRRTLGEQINCIASLKPAIADYENLLNALSELFIQGCKIDFSPLDTHLSRQKVTLPFYSFEGQRYWIPIDDATSSQNTVQGDIPLLGKKIDIALDDIQIECFEANLPSDMGSYLLDHKVCGQSIMPAAGYISLILAAIGQTDLAVVGAPLTVDNLEFHRPLILSDDVVRVQTLLQKNSDGEVWNAKVKAWDNTTKQWNLYASAKLVTHQSINFTQEFGRLDDKYAQEDIAAFYQRCADVGLEYGENFQALSSMRHDKDIAHGEIHLPFLEDTIPEDVYTLHPVILDAAFQMIVALVEKPNNKDQVPLPVGIEAITVYRQCGESVTVQARLRPFEEFDNARISDLVLRDPEGQIVAEISGLKAVWVDVKNIIGTRMQDELADMCYTPTWIKTDPASSKLPSGKAICVYPADADDLKLAIARKWSQPFVCEIVLGECTNQLSDEKWQVDCSSAGDVQKVIEQLPQFDTIFFLGGIQPAGANIANETYLQTASNQGVLSMFRMLKALSKYSAIDDQCGLNIVVTTNGATSVSDGETMLPLGASIAGLLRSASREFPQWNIHIIDTAVNDVLAINGEATLDDVAEKIIYELNQSDYEQVSLRSGQRYKRELTTVEYVPNKESSFKEKGVYLIIGGGGGIGLELAHYAAQQANARLVLIGRSELSTQQQHVIKDIEADGGDVLYLQADISDKQSLENAVKQAKTHFGELNGVIHSAAVVKDKSFENMDEQMLRQVLMPKVDGSINIYNAVKDEDLDFMLFFSSAMSLLGYAGQANYIAANAFQDAFAQSINQTTSFPVRTINWGFWGEIGVAADEFYHQRFASQGVYPVSNSEGMEAIRRVLISPEQQVAVVKAKVDVLRDMGVSEKIILRLDEQHKNIETAVVDKIDLISLEDLIELSAEEGVSRLLQGLSDLVGQVLRIDMRSEFDDNEQFSQIRLTSLGIDSLTTMDLRNRIGSWLGIDVPSELLIGGGRISEVVEMINVKLLLQRLNRPSTSEHIENDDAEVFVL